MGQPIQTRIIDTKQQISFLNRKLNIKRPSLQVQVSLHLKWNMPDSQLGFPTQVDFTCAQLRALKIPRNGIPIGNPIFFK